MYPDIDITSSSSEGDQMVARLRVYDARWVPTWGPIGLRQVRRLQRDGWSHVGSLPTGLIRREHCLLKISSIPEEQR